MNNPSAEADVSLLFEWAQPQGEKFLISVFLVGSLFLHALAFYLFRIIYPPTIAVLPPPAKVSLIANNSEEGRTLLRWIEAEDPALASATVRPTETRLRSLPKVAHVPSYMVQDPKLKDLPPMNLLSATPSAFPPSPVSTSRRVTEPAWPKMPTRLTFSDELKSLGQIKLPATRFNAATGEPPESVWFRIAVNRQGEIRYCFRINSSGDTGLDEQARLWLIQSRFAAQPSAADVDDQNLVWGVATVDWGNDISQPARSPTPAPP